MGPKLRSESTDLQNYMRYQPVGPLKEQERRPTWSANVFDRLDEEAYFYQRMTPFHYGRRIGSIPRDPMYEPGYSYDDKWDGPARSFEEDDNDEDLLFSYEIWNSPIPKS
ncbi:hypothetical protein Adt_41656 [Abeliophyllum distichum]|uniref:Uncharacterized protein n=1 Tax=Abeliophyllum distichum TaxID=126358 RepID=A0ABD1PPK5_9LAMI